MKSAGKRSRKTSSFSSGACHWANGIEPESNQTSMTSGTRVIVPAALRAREVDVVDVRAVRVLERARRCSCSSSANEPMHVHVARRRSARPAAACPSSARATAPSRRCSRSHSPKRPCLMCSGCQSTASLAASRSSRSLRRGDVPGRLGVVEQRRAAAPAVRVGVLVLLLAQQPAARAEVLDEVGVGVLDEAPGVRADALVVGAVEPHRVDDVEAVLLAEAEVVLAERDRGVHEAGAVVGRDEVAEQDGVAALAVGLARAGTGTAARSARRRAPRRGSASSDLARPRRARARRAPRRARPALERRRPCART